jgi:hypothetical protein
MSNNGFYLGEITDVRELRISKAKELAAALVNRTVNWTQFVECRRRDFKTDANVETIVFDVEVEVPQRKAHNIQRIERIAAVFSEKDNHYPEVFALRGDFPLVPHLNLRAPEVPRSLCIYDEPYTEVKLRWTAPRFIERIRSWLADTATGTLHREDQQLEPFLMGAHAPIVLPADLLGNGTQLPARINIFRVNAGPNNFCLIAERVHGNQNQPNAQAQKFNATVVVGEPQRHGIIQQQPATLSELHTLLLNANIDLSRLLRERLRAWQDDSQLLKGGMVLLVVLPKTRVEGGPEETPDLWAFLCTRVLPEVVQNADARGSVRCPTAEEIGVQLGLWTIFEGTLASLVQIDEEKDGSNVEVALLNPCFSLTRDSAAQFNGVVNPAGLRVAAIGAGALGSQVSANLIRSGYGEWAIVDKDFVLPHNPARHELPGFTVGTAKADTMAGFANTTIDGPPIAEGIVADILDPGELAGELKSRLSAAEVILDFSASVAVARHLDRDIDSNARRVSLFLNPRGTDLVLLAEDSNRQVTLTPLEMQYYRTLATESTMQDHLIREEGRLRYARSCRDLSAVIPQDFVALHAAIGSSAIRVTLQSEEPVVAIWQAQKDGTVARLNVAVSPVLWERRGEWKICFDKLVMERVQRLRSEKLPNETGGVLIGAFDLQRNIVYVVDALSAPQDSTEEPEGFIRGKHGLTETIETMERSTAQQLTYVGEWHSHPVGHGVIPSDKFDRKLFQWLTKEMNKDGLPPLMLIVGDRNQRGWYLGALPEFN